MSFYFSRSEWDHYSELYFAGANTQEMLEYFEKSPYLHMTDFRRPLV